MLQKNISPQDRYEHFIQRVSRTKVVWGLLSESLGWANSPSNDYENTDVILFWSDRSGAAEHQKEEWAGHIPTEIEFDDFIDAWLQGMDNDDVLAGPDWDIGLCGIEVTAQDLADRLLTEIEDD